MIKPNLGVESFWKEYAEKHGETVFAHSLGRYIGGWADDPDTLRTPLWGLIIATSGGFRFHHFAQDSVVSTLWRLNGGRDSSKELEIYIPKLSIINIDFYKEGSAWRRLLFATPPQLTLNYRDENEAKRILRADGDHNLEAVVLALRHGQVSASY